MEWSEFSATVGIRVTKSGGPTTCSGVLLSPKVVLTAAHCVDGFLSADVTTASDLSSGAAYTSVQKGELHPGYRGNLPGGSVDIGLFILTQPIPGPLAYPQLGFVDEDRNFERIGYGGRSGQNSRTWVTSTFELWFGNYIKARDELGVLGDSGGPVYQRQNGKLMLVGVHTGRSISSRGELEPYSFIQPLGSEIVKWITHQLQF